MTTFTVLPFELSAPFCQTVSVKEMDKILKSKDATSVHSAITVLK